MLHEDIKSVLVNDATGEEDNQEIDEQNEYVTVYETLISNHYLMKFFCDFGFLISWVGVRDRPDLVPMKLSIPVSK